jgi:hypothetical protein
LQSKKKAAVSKFATAFLFILFLPVAIIPQQDAEQSLTLKNIPDQQTSQSVHPTLLPV